MNIGEAVNALKSGEWIRRAGWNGKGMHVYLEDELEAAIGSRSERITRGRKVAPYLVLFTAAGVHQPGQVGFHTRIFTGIPRKNFLHAGRGHRASLEDK